MEEQIVVVKDKKTLGQFYTTNQKYILKGLKIPDYVKTIIEPFAGNGDLIEPIRKKYKVECYDIKPKKKYIKTRDTINNPPNYKDKYIITNPPYLARNKSKDKTMFDKYGVNDLYKCLIKELLTNKCLGGILIIPLNFWSSIRIADIKLRKAFLNVYSIILLNIFEEKVFDDTTYTVCSFQFELNPSPNKIKMIVYPSKTVIYTKLNDSNNYMIGGGIYKLNLKNTYKITRLTKSNKNSKNITNIVVKCIDDNENKKIGLSYVKKENRYVDETPNKTARTYATLIIEPPINKDMQKQLVVKFNEYLEKQRKKYNSLFLTNYRESKDIARKRISFDLVYSIVGYILENQIV